MAKDYSIKSTHIALLQGVSVHPGFPNPSADSMLENPDFNRLLIRHPVATYCMRIAGYQWQEQGIFDGDIVVIDRALSPQPSDLVIWWQNEGFVIAKHKLKPQEQIEWGVVSSIIHQCRP